MIQNSIKKKVFHFYEHLYRFLQTYEGYLNSETPLLFQKSSLSRLWGKHELPYFHSRTTRKKTVPIQNAKIIQVSSFSCRILYSGKSGFFCFFCYCKSHCFGDFWIKGSGNYHVGRKFFRRNKTGKTFCSGNFHFFGNF